MRKMMILAPFALMTACQQTPQWDGSIETLLNSQEERFGSVMQDPQKHRIQIIYTQIDRDADNRPEFTSFSYRLDPDEYFYPASTVKLPTAALALEKINTLSLPGLNRDTTMLTGSAADFQTEALADATSPTGLPSVGHYIRKIFLVSDNDAFNRLYEFIGQNNLNEALRAKGFVSTRIVHRLELALDTTQNQLTNPIRFMDGDTAVFDQSAVHGQVSYVGREPKLLGRAEIVGDKRLERPKDFSEKNSYSIQDLHDTVKILMFPNSVEPERRFNLADDDYQFMRRHMSGYPGESGIDEYSNADQYPPGYVKFLMYGGDAAEISDHIRIFNKVGDAYGFLTDAAYVVDFENKIEFLLAATIYVNENQTFNDNNYEYEEIGLPFLRNLGQAIYEIERVRNRPHVPGLRHFQFERNK